MSTLLLHGELNLRLRENGRVESLLSGVSRELEGQGLFVSELDDRQLSFNANTIETRKAGTDLEFIRHGNLTLINRGGTWIVRYFVNASTPPWLLIILANAIFLAFLIWTHAPLRFRIILTFPLPVITMASLGNRSAIKKRIRRLVAGAVNAQSGISTYEHVA